MFLLTRLRPVPLWLHPVYALLFVTGAFAHDRDDAFSAQICAPSFVLPVETTLGVEELDVPSVDGGVQIANTGEAVLRHGAFSLVTSTRVVADDRLGFFYSPFTQSAQMSDGVDLSEWMAGALSEEDRQRLITPEKCLPRDLHANDDNLLALEALDGLLEAMPPSASPHSGAMFGAMETRPMINARGHKIPTEHGTLIAASGNDFIRPIKSGSWDILSFYEENPLSVTGLFLPADESLPLMIVLDDRGHRSLVPAWGEVNFKDDITLPVKRPPLPGVVEQSLTYLGREGDGLRFEYRQFGTASNSDQVAPFTHDIRQGSTVSYQGARFDIIEATPYQIRYRLLASFTPSTAFRPPAFANP